MTQIRGHYRPATPLQMAIADYLGDGEWHSLDSVVRAVGHHIPAGKAHRRAERQRAKAKNAPPERVIPRPDEELIASGRKAIVREVLHGSTGAPKPYELRGERGAKEVRQVAVPPAVLNTRQNAAVMFNAPAAVDTMLSMDRQGRSLMLGDLTRVQLRSVARELLDRVDP